MKRKLVFGLVVLLCATAAHARNEHDDNFVDAMIMHHRDGIAMSRMAVQKAQHAELRDLAQKMIDEQEKDIRDLEAMRDTSESPTRPELADMPGMMGMNMRWLEAKSGNDFDVAFLLAMSEHHMGGIRMSRDEISRGSDARPKRKAREIAAKQQRERRTMMSWRRAWM